MDGKTGFSQKNNSNGGSQNAVPLFHAIVAQMEARLNEGGRAMMERWERVGFAPQYMVSSLGKVKNAKTGKLLKGSINNHGYIRYDLCLNGKRVVKSGHRLVAETFLSKVEGKPFINHKDGDKTNNDLCNLEWCTQKENTVHAFCVLGVQPWNKRAVKCVETGAVYSSAREAERLTGISNGQINRCCQGKRKKTRNLHWEYADVVQR